MLDFLGQNPIFVAYDDVVELENFQFWLMMIIAESCWDWLMKFSVLGFCC